jgi:hypothetical protein
MTKSIRWVARPLPGEDESLTGFLRQWARKNAFINRPQLLAALGLPNTVRIGAAELQELSVALGIDHAHLQAIAPSAVPARPALRSVLTRTRDEAVCPHCLAENDHSRQLWSHALATACPHHGVQLVDRCPKCGGTFGHNRLSARVCGCGMDLRSIETEPADPFECEFARRLTGDVPSDDPLPFLSGKCPAPADVDLFMLGLANHFSSSTPAERLEKRGKSLIPRSVELARARLAPAYWLLGEWPTRLSNRIDELIVAPSANATSGVAKRLGSWYRFLFKQFTDSAYDPIRVIAANCIARKHDGLVNARTRNIHSLATVEKNWYAIAECERELGVSAERINAAIDRGWVCANVQEQAVGYRERFLPRSEIERIRLLNLAHVDAIEARRLLEVPDSVFGFVLEAKMLDKGPPERTWTGSGDFERTSIDALIERLRNHDGRTLDVLPAPSDVVYLRDLGLRRTTDRSRLISAYRDIASGALPAIGCDGSSGIGGLAFSRADVAQRISSRSLAPVTLTLQQVADLTGAHYEAVKGWAECGLLRAQRPGGQTASPWNVELQALVEFLMTFTPLAHQASVLGSSTRGLCAKLAQRDLKPVNPEAIRGTLLRVSEILLAASR